MHLLINKLTALLINNMIRIYVTRQSRYPSEIKVIKSRVNEVLLEHNVSSACVSVALVGVRKMRELGMKYLGETEKHPLHEVLSFPANDSTVEKFPAIHSADLNLGDIIICYPEARRIAMKRNRMVDDVICELAGHGTMHLLGIHHE